MRTTVQRMENVESDAWVAIVPGVMIHPDTSRRDRDSLFGPFRADLIRRPPLSSFTFTGYAEEVAYLEAAAGEEAVPSAGGPFVSCEVQLGHFLPGRRVVGRRSMTKSLYVVGGSSDVCRRSSDIKTEAHGERGSTNTYRIK
jgi:hypothetical protein